MGVDDRWFMDVGGEFAGDQVFLRVAAINGSVRSGAAKTKKIVEAVG